MSIFRISMGLSLLAAVWSSPVDAAELREALMLQGSSCRRDQDNIRQTLLTLSGVTAVDVQSVPGYLLIDVMAGLVTSEELMGAVNRLYIKEGTCRAEPMQSCISPGGHYSAGHATREQQHMSREPR